MNKKEALKIINDGDTLRIEEIPKNLWEDKYYDELNKRIKKLILRTKNKK